MFKSHFQNLVRNRSEVVVNRILPYLKHAKKIVDIGSGTGDVAGLLIGSGKNIIPVDVEDFHGPRLLKTIIYDGKTLPFPDKTFDTALLLTVMHHTPDPGIIFSEAARVAEEIIVIETSFTNPVNKFFTVFTDTIANLRFNFYWNSYKSDKDWRIFFQRQGFKIIESRNFNDKIFGLLPFLHILYYLK